MKVEHVPLLQIQRDLYAMPRSYERFQTYLRTFSAADGTLALPPLVAMNPIGKDHNLALLDDYLALGAEAVAASATEEGAAKLAHFEGEWKLGLVIVDDLGGGWTNRYATEYTFRFHDGKEPEGLPRWLSSAWISVPLWTTEAASAEAVQRAVLTAIYRIAYVIEHRTARTLRERMAQEGTAMAMAGCTTPVLDADDLEYTRAVIAENLDATDMRTTIECL